jgi:hypothetical protein
VVNVTGICDEQNPYNNKDGEFFNPNEESSEGSWSLFFSKPDKGRQRLKKGSKKRYSLPNEVIKKCGRSGKYKCKDGKGQ